MYGQAPPQKDQRTDTHTHTRTHNNLCIYIYISYTHVSTSYTRADVHEANVIVFIYNTCFI